MSKVQEWLNKIETPITRDDKYLYQIILRLDTIIDLLNKQSRPVLTELNKPISLKDEPNESVTEEYIHAGNVDEILDDPMYDDDYVDYTSKTVAELREIAKENDIPGYYKMKKDELIDTLIKG